MIDAWEFKQAEIYYLDKTNHPKKITLSAYAQSLYRRKSTFLNLYMPKKELNKIMINLMWKVN